MIKFLLTYLLISNAPVKGKDKSILFSRIVMISLILTLLLYLNNLSVFCLDKGIFGGLLHVTPFTQTFIIFVLIVTTIILTITSFYPRKVSVPELSSVSSLLSYKFKGFGFNKIQISKKLFIAHIKRLTITMFIYVCFKFPAYFFFTQFNLHMLFPIVSGICACLTYTCVGLAKGKDAPSVLVLVTVFTGACLINLCVGPVKGLVLNNLISVPGVSLLIHLYQGRDNQKFGCCLSEQSEPRPSTPVSWFSDTDSTPSTPVTAFRDTASSTNSVEVIELDYSNYEYRILSNEIKETAQAIIKDRLNKTEGNTVDTTVTLGELQARGACININPLLAFASNYYGDNKTVNRFASNILRLSSQEYLRQNWMINRKPKIEDLIIFSLKGKQRSRILDAIANHKR